MQLRLLLRAISLVALGLVMLAVGIWVEDRAAVAAPLVIIGALIVVAVTIADAWTDVEEFAVGPQEGLRIKRRLPSPEQLTEAGIDARVAEQITTALQDWTDDLLEVTGKEIDRRVRLALTAPVRPRAARSALGALGSALIGEPVYYGRHPYGGPEGYQTIRDPDDEKTDKD
jgi:hypothetical protein